MQNNKESTTFFGHSTEKLMQLLISYDFKGLAFKRSQLV